VGAARAVRDAIRSRVLRGAAVISVHLDMPPSVNSIWRTTSKNGRQQTYRDPKYAKWMETAAWTVKEAVMKSGRIEGDVQVFSFFWPRRGDLDNRLKAVCDALVQGGAIEDDRKIVHLVASWQPPLAEMPPHVLVRVKPA
jgi:Holliday junction resolvase RusA-like endonuclease